MKSRNEAKPKKLIEYNMIEIGGRMQEARDSLRISRKDITNLVEVSESHLSDVEGGTKGISLHKLHQIVQVLDVSADYILYGPPQVSQVDDDSARRRLIIERISRDLNKYSNDELEYIADIIRNIGAINNK